MLLRINTIVDFFQVVRLCFGKSYLKEYHRLGGSETLRNRLLNSQRVLANIFFMIEKFFFAE